MALTDSLSGRESLRSLKQISLRGEIHGSSTLAPCYNGEWLWGRERAREQDLDSDLLGAALSLGKQLFQ